MKKWLFLIGCSLSFVSYADEMVFNCPETLYIDSVSLPNNQPLPFNIDLNLEKQPAIHLIGLNLYSNNQPIKSQKNDSNNYFWIDLNNLPQGLDEWIYFVCQYEHNIQLTKKAIYVSECKANTIESSDKKYLTYAGFQCE